MTRETVTYKIICNFSRVLDYEIFPEQAEDTVDQTDQEDTSDEQDQEPEDVVSGDVSRDDETPAESDRAGLDFWSEPALAIDMLFCM